MFYGISTGFWYTIRGDARLRISLVSTDLGLNGDEDGVGDGGYELDSIFLLAKVFSCIRRDDDGNPLFHHDNRSGG